MHPLLVPPFTNMTLRRAVQDYLAGGARKQFIVKKHGDISNWDVSMDTFQSLSGRLKEVVIKNIECISLTFDTFQLLSGWLMIRTCG